MSGLRKLVLVAVLALPSVCAAQSPKDVWLTNHDFFDLVCSDVKSSDKRALHVDVDAHGQFDVFVVKDGERTPVDARTYTNAITWTEGNDRWTLDRVKGTLESKSANEKLVCDRTGGRKF
jgi:hypothetical protein